MVFAGYQLLPKWIVSRRAAAAVLAAPMMHLHQPQSSSAQTNNPFFSTRLFLASGQQWQQQQWHPNGALVPRQSEPVPVWLCVPDCAHWLESSSSAPEGSQAEVSGGQCLRWLLLLIHCRAIWSTAVLMLLLLPLFPSFL